MSQPRALKLLAIDDTPQNLELIRAALEQLDLEIVTAEDPDAGFEIFLQMRPRIVLLDMVMPRVTGMELLERIVAADPGADVILMTAHYSPESAVEAIQKGACDYFTKPLDVEKLRTRIAGFLAEAERRRRTLHLDRELVDACQFEGMVGRSPLMLEVFASRATFQNGANHRCDGNREGACGSCSAPAEPVLSRRVRDLQLLSARRESGRE
jgi:DNA-binding NtrC family response regulator